MNDPGIVNSAQADCELSRDGNNVLLVQFVASCAHLQKVSRIVPTTSSEGTVPMFGHSHQGSIRKLAITGNE